MTTLADVIALARNDYLLVGTREQRNKLDGAISTTNGTTFTFLYTLNGIQTGAKVSVGLEDVYVWATDAAAKTATVERGEFGSTAATHSDGAVCTVNTRFSDAQILRAVNDELRSLSSPENGLFQIRTIDLTYSTGTIGYDLTGVTGMLSVWQVRYMATDSFQDSVLVPPNLWDHRRNLSTSDFATGQAIFLRGGIDSGATVRVTYRAAFSTLASLADDVPSVSGLHTEASDLLAIGASMRLLAGQEAHRNLTDAQSDPRRMTETPAGANLGGWRALGALRAQRIAEERTRLARFYQDRW